MGCRLSEQEEYSDDDDGSWKVRRAAARILAAIIATFPDLLPSIYPKVPSHLISTSVRVRLSEWSVLTSVSHSGCLHEK